MVFSSAISNEIYNRRAAAGPSLNIALKETVGEPPAFVPGCDVQKRKEQGSRIALRDGMKKIHLDLRKVVKAVVEDSDEWLQKLRNRRSRRGDFMEVGI